MLHAAAMTKTTTTSDDTGSPTTPERPLRPTAGIAARLQRRGDRSSIGSNYSEREGATPPSRLRSMAAVPNDGIIDSSLNEVDHNTWQENINTYLQDPADDVIPWFAGIPDSALLCSIRTSFGDISGRVGPTSLERDSLSEWLQDRQRAGNDVQAVRRAVDVLQLGQVLLPQEPVLKRTPVQRRTEQRGRSFLASVCRPAGWQGHHADRFRVTAATGRRWERSISSTSASTGTSTTSI